MTQDDRTGSVRLSIAERSRLAALVRVRGERFTIDELGVSTATLSRALAGLGIRRGSFEIIANRLEKAEV